MQIPDFITYSLDAVGQIKYVLVFIGMIVEGPIVMVASGFFLRLGAFTLLPLYFVLVIGDLVADIMWYYIGYYFAEPIIKKRGHLLSITPEIFEKMKGMLHNNQTKILLGSKLTMGFGLAIATIVSAGASRISFKKFFFLQVIGEIFLAAILLSVGYFLGHFYTYIYDGFKILFLIAGITFGAILVFGFTKYIKNRILKSRIEVQ